MNTVDSLDTKYEPYFGSEDVSELEYSFGSAVSLDVQKWSLYVMLTTFLFVGLWREVNTDPGNRRELLHNELWANMPIAMATTTFQF